MKKRTICVDDSAITYLFERKYKAMKVDMKHAHVWRKMESKSSIFLGQDCPKSRKMLFFKDFHTKTLHSYQDIT